MPLKEILPRSLLIRYAPFFYELNRRSAHSKFIQRSLLIVESKS